MLELRQPLRRQRARLAARRSLGRLGERSQALRDALSDAIGGSTLPEERRWIERIERRRASLEAGTEELAIRDYGAGSPEDGRSEEEMRDGLVVHRTVGEVCRSASKPPLWAGLLFRLVRELRPVRCLELGTCLGVSAAYQAAALKLNGQGLLVTIEGSDSLAAVASETLAELGLSEQAEVRVGPFAETLRPALDERGPFDFSFVDGHHDEAATLAYFGILAESSPAGSVLVFDDVSWSPGMARAWRAIASDSRVATAVDLGAVGICVLGADEGDHIELPFAAVARPVTTASSSNGAS